MYPYKRGDRVMIGISTWPAGEPSKSTRYFQAATVEANDREAGALAIKSDVPHAGGHGYETYLFEDFNGEEIVPYDESYPTTPEAAHEMMEAGTHPDLLFEVKRWDEVNVGDVIFLDGYGPDPILVQGITPSLFEPGQIALSLAHRPNTRAEGDYRVKVVRK